MPAVVSQPEKLRNTLFLPVEKKAGSFVYAGTTNLHGFITCKATKVQGDTTLGQIIEMVENTASSKAPIAKVADKVSGIFVPAVVTIAVITCIIWMILGKNFGFALARAISVLVISCPCALGLATPVAIMVGSGVGARNGILFKTATALEQTGKTKIVVLDKTGTVTKGKPSVTDIYSAENVTKEQLLAMAAALESKSEHPLASAVVEYAKENGLTVVVTDHHEVPFEEKGDGERIYIKPKADAIVNPKQAECTYPFPKLCGAGVTFKLAQILYERYGILKSELEPLIEYAAIATVAHTAQDASAYGAGCDGSPAC